MTLEAHVVSLFLRALLAVSLWVGLSLSSAQACTSMLAPSKLSDMSDHHMSQTVMGGMSTPAEPDGMDCDGCPDAAVSFCDCDDTALSIVLESPAEDRFALSVRIVHLIPPNPNEAPVTTPHRRPPDRRALFQTTSRIRC